MEKSKVIFGNEIDKKTYKKACKSQRKWIKKFGDDRNKEYHLSGEPIEELSELGIVNLVSGDQPIKLKDNAVVVGNIRMGFGHYRISIAMASCAKALGYTPYWFDLMSFKDSTGSKMISAQNDLYSLGSKLSQKFKLFNKLVWEPMNSEGFRKLSYNAPDQKNAELLAPLYHDLPKDVPFVGTHAWPSQGAIHAGLTHVVNAIPDNWPMALHLSEGSIHTIQTPFAYLGYRILNGFDPKKKLKPIPEKDLVFTGCYVDHELVSNIEEDCANRIKRSENGEAMRFLITVGGAGAGAKMYASMLKHLVPYIKAKKAAVFINVGDHFDVYDYLLKQVPEAKEISNAYLDEYSKVKELVHKMEKEKMEGLYFIANHNIFEAVYSTNLLMRFSDVLITKPSELSFYPIPKIFNKHIGGHERYGAIFASQAGDSTWECEETSELLSMIDTFINVPSVMKDMAKRIIELKKAKYYDGGYEVIKLAVNGRK